MKNNDKLQEIQERFIPLNGEHIPVSEDVYKEYYRPIWRVHDHARRHGQCGCSDWKRCEGDCALCSYRIAGNTLSLDFEFKNLNGEALSLVETVEDPSADIESIVSDRIILEELYRALQKIDPDGRRICELIRQGKSERDAAADLGIPRMTYKYRKDKVLAKLRESLKHYI